MTKIQLRGLLLLLCLLVAGAALADVRPPVELRLLGTPHALVPGEPYRGQLELTTDRMADFTDFRFEGDGWHQSRLDAPGNIFIDKGGRLVIDFELEADATTGQLEFVYDFDGYTMRHNLDLSAEHLKKMTTPGTLRSVRDDRAPAPAGDDMVRPDAPEAPPADKSSGGDDEPGVVVNRTIRVHGRFVFQRSDGTTIGADGVWVRVYDDDLLFDQLLASVTTDAFGYYDVNINTSDAGETNPDLYVRFDAQNSRTAVKDNTFGNVYGWQTGVSDNYAGSDLNYGSLQPTDESQHPALNILTDVTRTWRWILNHEGYNTPAVDCRWPDGATGAFYNGSIHVGVDREWNESTHSHEYGHHWIANYAVQVSPDYCNGICDGATCGHCIWCQETDHDAFSEGWPNWLADVLTRSYAGDYGIAPLVFRSQENLSTCGGVLDDPLLTEGFLGAIMRDIEDSTNDDHPQFPGFADVMSWGTNEIFDVVDFDHPTTPMGFLNAFKARFPSSKEVLWETAKNCGYEIDVTAPGAPTGLTSSHATTGDSPDATVYYAWTIPTDDASGIAGYGIFISSGPGMPSAVMDIGDVSSYTTDPLAPGTYYFNLRAVDRAGRWSGSYATYGPVTIRAAEPSDLTYRTSATWDYPIVPRNDATATASVATVAPTLDGNTNNSYWNVIGKNQGESTTSVGFQSRLYVDNVYRYAWSWGAIGAGGAFYGVNGGPFTVTGGRHTFEVKYDATDIVPEVNESNNVYAHQFIWTPLGLAANTAVNRNKPPELTGGWNSIIDGQPKYYNCDGVAPTSLGWWNAITVRPLSDADDYDLRLHDPSTGSQNGFGSSLAFSGRTAGYLDAVVFNRNVTGAVYYNAGVLNWNGGSGSFAAEHVTSTAVSFGDSLDIAFGADKYLLLKEFYVGAADTGYVSITVDIDPAQGPVYVQWLDKFFDTGTLYSYNLQSVTDPSTGRARLDFHVGDIGFNCLLMYRDQKDGGAALNTTVEIQRTPPDFKPQLAAGWHAPVVPRPANDGTGALVALPDTLHGNIASTYLNLAVRNESPTGNPSLLGRVFLDGVYSWWLSWGNFPGYAQSLFNWGSAWTVRGGRHTLDMRVDPLNDIEEIWEDNNIYGEQYVWSPLAVPAGTQTTRNAPPDRVGGWDEITSGETLWYNCDGLRMPGFTHWWQVMAVMPAAGSDTDIRLHPQLTGAKAGFSTNSAYSGWGPESSDFVVVNYNIATQTGYDVGVLRVSGTSGYTADHEGASYLGTDPSGPTPVFTVPSGSIVQIYELYLNPGSFAVHLVDQGGDVDWGLSLMPSNQDYMSKSDALASAWAQPAGGREEINDVTITTAGYYSLVVWKAKTADLAKTGPYQLIFGNGVSDVPDQVVPQVTALRNVYPNPFNPQTTIVFDLAREGRAEIAIYDLKGSLVRTLTDDQLGVGRHEAVWNGTDNHGQRVASGVYMARMRAGDYSEMKKLMLVK